MEFKAKDIAALLGGVVDGDPEVIVNNVSKIEEGKPGTLFLPIPNTSTMSTRHRLQSFW